MEMENDPDYQPSDEGEEKNNGAEEVALCRSRPRTRRPATKRYRGGRECLKTVKMALKIKAWTIRNPDNVNISKRYADCNYERLHVAL